MTVRGRPVQPKCTAHSSITGKPCGNFAVIGTHVCRMHGAKQSLTKRGAANPAYKDGKRSKYATHVLAGEKYLAALADPDLLTNKHEIALLESIMHSTSDDLAAVLEPKLWQKLDDQCHAFRAALQSGNKPDQIKAFLGIERIRDVGLQSSTSVKSLREMFLERDRLVTSQTKMEVQAGQMMTAEQVTGFVMMLSQIINNRIPDVAMRDAIQADLMSLLRTPVE